MVPAAGRRRFMRLRASTRVRPVSTRRPWEPNERCGALVSQASRLADVRYDIRGPVLRRARQLEAEGHQILKLNLGNPAPFGMVAPDAVLADVVQNVANAQGYSDARGIYPARAAVARYYQGRGVTVIGPD